MFQKKSIFLKDFYPQRSDSSVVICHLVVIMTVGSGSGSVPVLTPIMSVRFGFGFFLSFPSPLLLP